MQNLLVATIVATCLCAASGCGGGSSSPSTPPSGSAPPPATTPPPPSATTPPPPASSAPPVASSTLSIEPANPSIIQGGIITLAVSVSGGGLSGGTLNLSGSDLLSQGSDDLDASPNTDKIGYAFNNVGNSGGNLSLYVGNQVPVDSYSLTLTGTADGKAYRTSLTLRVAASGQTYMITPSDNYQNYLTTLRPGDVLVLHAGTYSGPAVLTLNGTQEKPITIRGYGQGKAMPVLKYTGSASNLWEIRGSHLIIEGLKFDTTQTNPIRIRAPGSGGIDDVTIIGNEFAECGDICITANGDGVSYQNLRILYNLMLNSHETGVYIGNQQGQTPVTNFLFEGNVIDDRLMTDSSAIGYGIEVKLNVKNATLRHNYIVGAKGPGIMTYGLDRNADPRYRNIVDGNIVIGSCTDQNIVIGAGPALVSNNLSMGGSAGGYDADDYGNRHLSAGIQLTGNTAVLNNSSDFWINPNLKTSGLADLQMTNNLAYPPTGGPGYRNLPLDTAPAVIKNNNIASPTAAMVTEVTQLKGLIPSPQDLRAVWPLLSHGPLQSSSLANLLKTLTALPNQSNSSAPRPCS